MRRVSDIIGRPIKSDTTGSTLGYVSDLLLDTDRGRAIGIIIRGGWLRREWVLPFPDFQMVGIDAPMARSCRALTVLRRWRKGELSVARSRTLNGKAVVTCTGRRIGAVEDLMIDEETGDAQVVEITTSHDSETLGRRVLLPVSSGLAIGGDAIVVWDAMAEHLDGADISRS
jgi:uncharacterized protein YrrD